MNRQEEIMGFRNGSVVKNLPANAEDAGDAGLSSGLGRSSGGRNGGPCQYSCLENPMTRGAWQATVQGVTKSWKQLSNLTELKRGDNIQPLHTPFPVLNQSIVLCLVLTVAS